MTGKMKDAFYIALVSVSSRRGSERGCVYCVYSIERGGWR